MRFTLSKSPRCRSKHSEAALARGDLALRFVQILAQFARDKRAIGIDRNVTGEVEQVSNFETTFVNAFRGRKRWKRQAEFGEFFFYHFY